MELVNVITYKKFLAKDYKIISASVLSEMFIIENKDFQVINFTDLKPKTVINYTDETSLYLFQIFCVCYDIDPYNYFTYKKSNSGQITCKLVHKNIETNQVVKYDDIPKDRLLFYIPFARFFNTKIKFGSNQYTMLLELDKIYISKDKSLRLNYTPYPEFAPKETTNVYLKELFTLPELNIDLTSLAIVNIYKNHVTMQLTKNILPLAQKNDLVIITNQNIDNWNGEYIVQTVTNKHVILQKQTQEHKYDNEMCIKNSSCPFYNIQTGNGGCISGYCQMPVGVERIGYKDYKNTPFCFGCPDELKPRCCNDPDRFYFL